MTPVHLASEHFADANSKRSARSVLHHDLEEMPVEIREARSGEEEQLRKMYDWLFAPPGLKPWQWDPESARQRLSEAIASPRSVILVAEEAGALVAFCTAYLELNSVRLGQRCWVEDFAVDPERRSQGIGVSLLDAAKEWARRAGATHLELDSGLARNDAHRFYEREGGTRQSYTFGWELCLAVDDGGEPVE